MSKIIFKMLPTKGNIYDNESIRIVTDSCGLNELLDTFKRFLLAAGFYIDGSLQVVPDPEDEEPIKTTEQIKEEIKKLRQELAIRKLEGEK